MPELPRHPCAYEPSSRSVPVAGTAAPVVLSCPAAIGFRAGQDEGRRWDVARLALVTRPGCHLCEVAAQELDRIAADTGEAWEEIDVESDIELEREYGDRVPVVLLDGREHGYWRVEPERLRRDLAAPRR